MVATRDIPWQFMNTSLPNLVDVLTRDRVFAIGQQRMPRVPDRESAPCFLSLRYHFWQIVGAEQSYLKRQHVRRAVSRKTS